MADETMSLNSQIHITATSGNKLSLSYIRKIASKYNLKVTHLESSFILGNAYIHDYYIADREASIEDIETDYRQKRLIFCDSVLRNIEGFSYAELSDLGEMLVAMGEYSIHHSKVEISIQKVALSSTGRGLQNLLKNEKASLKGAELLLLNPVSQRFNERAPSHEVATYEHLGNKATATWYPDSGVSIVGEDANGERYSLQLMKWNNILFNSNQTYEHEFFLYNYDKQTYLNGASTLYPGCFPKGAYAATSWPKDSRPYIDTRLSQKYTGCEESELEFTIGAAVANKLVKGKTYFTYFSTAKGKSDSGKFKINSQLGHRSPKACYTTWCSYGDEHATLVKSWNSNVPGTVQWGEERIISPEIGQDPMSGPPGTKFVQWGKNFCLRSTATLHFRKPDGSEYRTAPQKTDDAGSFKISYIAPKDKSPGTYTWWAVDDLTKEQSNEISYVITGGSTGSISGKLHSDSASGSALSGATVTCAGKSTTTKSDGTFSLTGIPSGTQTIVFSKSGYITYERPISVSAGQNTDVGDRWLVKSSDPPQSKGPDLAVHKLTINKPGQGEKHTLDLVPGEAFEINVWVKNRGKAKATKEFSIKYLLSDDSHIEENDSVLGEDKVKDDVSAGKTYHDQKVKNIKAPSTEGIYYIGAWVNSPQDSNKANDFSRGDGERGKIIVKSPAPPPPNPHTPDGSLEKASCDSISGWARDPDTTSAIKVRIYADGLMDSGRLLGEVVANGYRSDLPYADKNHGFTFSIPTAIKDGVTHSIYAYGLDNQGGTNPLLNGSPQCVFR